MSIARSRSSHARTATRLAALGLVLLAGTSAATTAHAAEADSDAPVAAFGIIPTGPFVEGDSGTTEIGWFATSPVPATEDCTLEVVYGGGSADLGTDVEVDDVNGVFIAAGSTSGLVTGNVVGDTLIEGDETVTMTVRAASISGFPACPVVEGSAATVIITDDDRPELTVTGEDVVEGNTGTRPMRFTIQATEPIGERCELGIVVDLPRVVEETLRGGAVAALGAAGADDIVAPGGIVSVEMAAGATSATFAVDVLGDVVLEDDEAVRVTVIAGPGEVLPDCATSPVDATALILNDDEPSFEPETPTSEAPTTTEVPSTVPPTTATPETTATTAAPTTAPSTTEAPTTTAPATTGPATTVAPEVLSQGPVATTALPVVSGQLPTTGSDGGSLVTLAGTVAGLGAFTVLLARVRRRPV